MSGYDNDKGAAVLAAVMAKRDYVLPYHRLLAETDPDLLAAYDAFYEKLTLTPRAFDDRARELVWAGLLVATREHAGTLHMRRAARAGLTSADLSAAAAIAAVVEGQPALAFAGRDFGDWIQEPDARARYLALFETARDQLPEGLAHIIATVCHAARESYDGIKLHAPLAFAAGATRHEMAEGLSYLLLPCGGPTFIDAVEAWQAAAEAGNCPPPFEKPLPA